MIHFYSSSSPFLKEKTTQLSKAPFLSNANTNPEQASTMRFTSLALLSFGLASLTHGLPMQTRQLNGVTVLDDLLIFDGAAFPDPNRQGETLIGLQSFVSLRQIDLTPFLAEVESILNDLGVDVGDNIQTVESRIRLLGAIGLPAKAVRIDVAGCNTQLELPRTSLSDLGMTFGNIPAGQCDNSRELTATADLSFLDSRTIQGTIFNSPDSGFAVISDIDDTVKISNVLDKAALAQSTLIDDPKPVAGMPELYASLSQSLNDPQFVYVSGSPFQLYPLLRDFIADSYPQARGPILLQNLTIANIPEFVEFVQGNGDAVQEYKVSMVDRVQSMYPNKRYLTIGDSTQRDPETYAEACVSHLYLLLGIFED